MIQSFTPYNASVEQNNMQNRIKTVIDKIVGRDILDGIMPTMRVLTSAAGVRTITTDQTQELTNRIPLTTSFQDIPHNLGRKPLGWIAVAPDADARIWEDTAVNNPDPTKFIRVRASATVNCSFWVF